MPLNSRAHLLAGGPSGPRPGIFGIECERSFNQAESATLVAKKLVAGGIRRVIITLGANGCFLAGAALSEHVPPFAVKSIDSSRSEKRDCMPRPPTHGVTRRGVFLPLHVHNYGEPLIIVDIATIAVTSDVDLRINLESLSFFLKRLEDGM